VASDRALLLRELEPSRLGHHARFPGAIVGNGLMILSAFPIEETWFHRFAHSGKWWRPWEGDFWAGKGVGMARIRLPSGGFVDFFDTHAQAGRGNPENVSVRYGQMEELAAFVREARLPVAPAFVVGDFNTKPGAADYELARAEAGLVRAMNLPSEIDHIFAVRDPRYRFEVLESREITGRTRGSEPELFVSRAPTFAEFWHVLNGEPEETALSDHPGYLSTVRISPTGALLPADGRAR